MSGLAMDCPAPLESDTVQLAHGGGGRRMRHLIEELFLPAFDGPLLRQRHDSAVFDAGAGRVAFTTDSYVVSPLFFPGGDIGKLAVYGTVNDLAAAGARPLHLSASFILEEGLPLDVLRRVVASMRDAARAAGVDIVTGDTKVVDRGKGDGVFVNTSGIGMVAPGIDVGPHRIAPGDAVLLTGDLGRHGIAILSVRQGLAFESPIESDCAPLNGLALALQDAGVDVHCMRDLTRGGLASALNELALDAGVGIDLDEAHIPVSDGVAGACELLGLDPLHVANEGRMAIFVSPDDAGRALSAMRAHPEGRGSVRAGAVGGRGRGTVVLRTRMGGRRVIDLLSGEQLPRIC